MTNNVIQIECNDNKFLVSYKDISFYFDETGNIDQESQIDFLKFLMALDFTEELKINAVEIPRDEDTNNINVKIGLIKTWLGYLNKSIKERIDSDSEMAKVINSKQPEETSKI